jgi:hypothetical protein
MTEQIVSERGRTAPSGWLARAMALRTNSASSAQAQKSPPKTRDIAPIRSHEEGERFIRVSQFALLERLADPQSWPDHDAEQIRLFFDNLTRWRNLYYSDELDRLTQNYLPFDPDADINLTDDLSEEQKLAHQKTLFEGLDKLIEGANYDEINQQELDLIMTANSPTGVAVHVDLSEFEEQMLFARGADFLELSQRDWRYLFLRKRTYKVPIFRRLFLALKFKSDEFRIREVMQERGLSEKKARKLVAKKRSNLPEGVCTGRIYLKLFKNIPQIDLEMLYPNTQVRLKYADKVWLWVSGGSGGLIGLFTAVPKIVASTAVITTNPIALFAALGGLAAVFFRQVMNFFNTRNKYMMQLAQSLYFQSLANNRGALTLLIDRAEEEDIKEDALLYSLIVKEPVHKSEIEDARVAIEQYLRHEFGITLRYDIHDAIRRLKQDGLLYETDAGELRVLPVPDALALLREKWSHALDANFDSHEVQTT